MPGSSIFQTAATFFPFGLHFPCLKLTAASTQTRGESEASDEAKAQRAAPEISAEFASRCPARVRVRLHHAADDAPARIDGLEVATPLSCTKISTRIVIHCDINIRLAFAEGRLSR
jgi:hypothetical protein